jgi:adenylate cyclase
MIRLSPRFKRKVTSILPFGIIWLITGLIFLFVEYAIISTMKSVENLPVSNIVLSPKIIVFASISVFVLGCLVGFIEVYFINKFFARVSFRLKILSKLLIYSLMFFAVIFIFYMLAASIEMKESVFSRIVYDRYLIFLFSMTNLSTSVQIAFSLLLSLIYAEVEDNLGQAVFLNFFTGKYHRPVVEQRIFMFTDMKDSTSIAETMGHIRYFDFLRHYYEDLSDAIINSYGEVYQYIGDEIVISWNTNKSSAVEHSLRCFFMMKEDLAKKRDWYLDHFGTFPAFKGALHLGEVTTGEIGALKKEIFFTGDVLNTAARIQGLCTKYGVDLLVSKAVVDALDLNLVISHMGSTSLKGKKETVELYTIGLNQPYL